MHRGRHGRAGNPKPRAHGPLYLRAAPSSDLTICEGSAARYATAKAATSLWRTPGETGTNTTPRREP